MISTITNFIVVAVLAFICILASATIIVIAKITNKNLPKVYWIIYLICFIAFMAAILTIPLIGYDFKNEGLYLLVIFLVTAAAFVGCITYSSYVSKLQEIDKVIEKRLEYRKLTAKTVAEQNGIEYIPEIRYEDINNIANGTTRYSLKNSKYILLSPLNNGEGIDYIEWVENASLNDLSVSSVKVVLANKNCFLGISNLDEILKQMISLYSDNIDKDVFISSAGFAIKLEDEIKAPYKGKAKLVLTDKAILNGNVSSTEKLETKKKCINIFLDFYLTLNFGNVFRNNEELDRQLREFNSEVIAKGLREFRRAYGMRYNKYIQKIHDLNAE